MLLTLLSLPDGWNLSAAGLQKILPDGKDKISHALNAIAAILLFLIFVVAPIIEMILLGLKYYESVGDYVTVAFHLVLLALIVWLADFSGFIGCTMLTVWFWINVGYILIRFIVYMKENYW